MNMMMIVYNIAKTPVVTKNLESDEKLTIISGCTLQGLPFASVELSVTPVNSNENG